MKLKYFIYVIIITLIALGFIIFRKNNYSIKNIIQNQRFLVGEKIDSFNGVYVYKNGILPASSLRNIAPDGYNLGLRYQCVEFVKRYYYQHLKHKMPDSYGDAKDFFDKSLKDGQINKKRNLVQYRNGSFSKPKVNDILIFDASSYSSYGHVAIISDVEDDEIEIIQQNCKKSRNKFSLTYKNKKWRVNYTSIVGWLRKE